MSVGVSCSYIFNELTDCHDAWLDVMPLGVRHFAFLVYWNFVLLDFYPLYIFTEAFTVLCPLELLCRYWHPEPPLSFMVPNLGIPCINCLLYSVKYTTHWSVSNKAADLCGSAQRVPYLQALVSTALLQVSRSVTYMLATRLVCAENVLLTR